MRRNSLTVAIICIPIGLWLIYLIVSNFAFISNVTQISGRKSVYKTQIETITDSILYQNFSQVFDDARIQIGYSTGAVADTTVQFHGTFNNIELVFQISYTCAASNLLNQHLVDLDSTPPQCWLDEIGIMAAEEMSPSRATPKNFRVDKTLLWEILLTPDGSRAELLFTDYYY